MKTKTRTTDRDWRDALENIENIVSREHIDKLEKDTIEHSIEVLNGISNPILSYSGGKDSIVLEAVLALWLIATLNTQFLWTGYINTSPKIASL